MHIHYTSKCLWTPLLMRSFSYNTAIRKWLSRANNLEPVGYKDPSCGAVEVFVWNDGVQYIAVKYFRTGLRKMELYNNIAKICPCKILFCDHQIIKRFKIKTVGFSTKTRIVQSDTLQIDALQCICAFWAFSLQHWINVNIKGIIATCFCSGKLAKSKSVHMALNKLYEALKCDQMFFSYLFIYISVFCFFCFCHLKLLLFQLIYMSFTTD